MIDWHSHILPGVDDGSHDVAESVAMLEMLGAQNIHTVVATPHFYANDGSVAGFLERRREAWELLRPRLPENAPQVVLGAEVRYYQGISRLENLRDLCIEGTKFLLLEMPMAHWPEYAVRELVEISGKDGIKLVLAHIERYWDLQKKSVWKSLYENGILMQVNASHFTGLLTRGRAISLLQEGGIHFVGSDCHNTTTRAPQLDKAYGMIRKKLGDEFVNQMNEYGFAVLGR